jgi:hypothetical protein
MGIDLHDTQQPSTTPFYNRLELTYSNTVIHNISDYLRELTRMHNYPMPELSFSVCEWWCLVGLTSFLSYVRHPVS